MKHGARLCQRLVMRLVVGVDVNPLAQLKNPGSRSATHPVGARNACLPGETVGILAPKAPEVFALHVRRLDAPKAAGMAALLRRSVLADVVACLKRRLSRFRVGWPRHAPK